MEGNEKNSSRLESRNRISKENTNLGKPRNENSETQKGISEVKLHQQNTRNTIVSNREDKMKEMDTLVKENGNVF